jgi:hypothetical protein
MSAYKKVIRAYLYLSPKARVVTIVAWPPTQIIKYNGKDLKCRFLFTKGGGPVAPYLVVYCADF